MLRCRPALYGCPACRRGRRALLSRLPLPRISRFSTDSRFPVSPTSPFSASAHCKQNCNAGAANAEGFPEYALFFRSPSGPDGDLFCLNRVPGAGRQKNALSSRPAERGFPLFCETWPIRAPSPLAPNQVGKYVLTARNRVGILRKTGKKACTNAHRSFLYLFYPDKSDNSCNAQL